MVCPSKTFSNSGIEDLTLSSKLVSFILTAILAELSINITALDSTSPTKLLTESPLINGLEKISIKHRIAIVLKMTSNH